MKFEPKFKILKKKGNKIKKVKLEEISLIDEKERRTFEEWYEKLWSANSAFRIVPPLEENRKKKITRREFEKYII